MSRPEDLIDRMMSYESGDLSWNEMVALFQELIDSGDVWKLQGHYGRSAQMLIESGYCQAPERPGDEGCQHEWASNDVCWHCGARKSI